MSTTSNSIKQSYGQKLRNRRSETNAAKNIFTNEIVGKWNGLPREVVNSSSIDSFKKILTNTSRMYPIDIL